MHRLIAIYQRELSYFYNSTVAYVVITIFTVLAGYFFYNLVAFFSMISMQAMQAPGGPQGLSITETVLQPLYGNLSIIMLLVMPLLTMRLLSEERKTGTAELLFTYPISDWDAILGKYLATMTVFVSMLAITLVFPLLLTRYLTPEWGPILTSYLGLTLLGMAFVAMGLFFSSLSENQLVAGILTFGCAMLFLIIGWIQPFVSANVAAIVAQISILEHFESFSKGVVDSNDVVYYVNFSALFLFLCSRILESNRWRG